jgi:hypothetical protein
MTNAAERHGDMQPTSTASSASTELSVGAQPRPVNSWPLDTRAANRERLERMRRLFH